MAILSSPSRAGALTTAALMMSALLSPASAQPPSVPDQLYVAPWGEDSWPGTLNRPFATPARAG